MADKSASNGHGNSGSGSGNSFSNGPRRWHEWFCACIYCLQGHK